MRIGELARQCSVNPRTIRYYEVFGLLPRAARTSSGHRIYSERDLQRLRFVRRAKQIGLPLASIRRITAYANTGACQLRPRLKELILAQLAEIKDRIKDLRDLQRELRAHYASLLCQLQTRPRGAAGCSCLDGPPRKTAFLPTAALVKRPLRRKS